MKANDIIDIICKKAKINRNDNTSQFLSKEELLLVLAHIEHLNMHIKSLKAEVEIHREHKAQVEARLHLGFETTDESASSN